MFEIMYGFRRRHQHHFSFRVKMQKLFIQLWLTCNALPTSSNITFHDKIMLRRFSCSRFPILSFSGLAQIVCIVKLSYRHRVMSNSVVGVVEDEKSEQASSRHLISDWKFQFIFYFSFPFLTRFSDVEISVVNSLRIREMSWTSPLLEVSSCMLMVENASHRIEALAYQESLNANLIGIERKYIYMILTHIDRTQDGSHLKTLSRHHQWGFPVLGTLFFK